MIGLRKATVETADDCEFLTIDIASYQSSMEEITAQRNEAKTNFFRRLPLFEVKQPPWLFFAEFGLTSFLDVLPALFGR
jgi:hypothetical protein